MRANSPESAIFLVLGSERGHDGPMMNRLVTEMLSSLPGGGTPEARADAARLLVAGLLGSPFGRERRWAALCLLLPELAAGHADGSPGLEAREVPGNGGAPSPFAPEVVAVRGAVERAGRAPERLPERPRWGEPGVTRWPWSPGWSVEQP